MKKVLALLICFSVLSSVNATVRKKTVKKAPAKIMKKVVMIIAKNGFRDEEYIQPKEILTKSKVEVVTAASSKGTAKGMLGATVNAEITIDQIDVKNYDAVIFVGGTGASEYWDDPVAHKVAQESIKARKVLAAICISPVTLAKSGVLKGKKATVFSSEAEELKKYGATYTGEKVEVDGNIVTASGPEASKQFGEKISELLNKGGGKK